MELTVWPEVRVVEARSAFASGGDLGVSMDCTTRTRAIQKTLSIILYLALLLQTSPAMASAAPIAAPARLSSASVVERGVDVGQLVPLAAALARPALPSLPALSGLRRPSVALPTLP